MAVPPRAHLNFPPNLPREHGQSIHDAISRAGHKFFVEARELEIQQAALAALREHIEAGNLRLQQRGPVEVAVFGQHFRVELVSLSTADEHMTRETPGVEVVAYGNQWFTISNGWLARDEVVGALCRWCAGTGLNPDLSRTKRQILELWQPEPEKYRDLYTEKVSTRVVRGVCFDHPFAGWMQSGPAEELLATHCITEDEARCPRCLGWGDERAT